MWGRATFDPDHFRSTTQDAYRPVDPSAYKRALPQEEQEDVGPRHVDPDHFRSTTQDAYRPVDPSAYKRESPVVKDVRAVNVRHAYPDTLRSVSHESYKSVDSSAYKRESPVVKDLRAVNVRHAYPDTLRSVSHESYKPLNVASTRDGLSRAVCHRISDGKSAQYGECSSSSFVSNGDRNGIDGASSSCRGSARACFGKSSSEVFESNFQTPLKGTDDGHFSSKGYFCPCHTDPEMYRSTSHADYKAHHTEAYSRPYLKPLDRKFPLERRDFLSEYKKNFLRPEPQSLSRPVAVSTVTVRHVDPSVYTTTNQAVFKDHWKQL
ncbi:microtubule-associated protein [Trypanosoma cruzi]|nr:microtubule-associated protein [Trypanosoma cruzi]